MVTTQSTEVGLWSQYWGISIKIRVALDVYASCGVAVLSFPAELGFYHLIQILSYFFSLSVVFESHCWGNSLCGKSLDRVCFIIPQTDLMKLGPCYILNLLSSFECIPLKCWFLKWSLNIMWPLGSTWLLYDFHIYSAFNAFSDLSSLTVLIL